MIPYFAIGSDELDEKRNVGNTAKCPNCGKKHKVLYGYTNGIQNKMLGFVKCGEDSFLVAVSGKEL